MKINNFFKILFINIGFFLLPITYSYAAALPTYLTESNYIPSLAPMLEKVLPAVVSVHVEGTKSIRRNYFKKEFKYFFGNYITNNGYLPFEGLGSGVIINAIKGYVITNNHVVNSANKINVQLNDGREFNAKLIGYDEKTDLALLQLPIANNINEIKIANSDNINVGDFAVAIGNPFGIGQTATSGIISAIGRSCINLKGLENFIQTDASINRGNSGGALVNLNGELIGINTAILTPGGGNIGIGFAIPSNIVKNLSKQFIDFGEVKRGKLGIKGTELTEDIYNAFNIKAQRGAFVSEVLQKSAAAKAGVKAGDIIISVEGKKINSFSELRAKIGTTAPGITINLGLLRNGKFKNIYVVLDDSALIKKIEKILNPALKGASLSNGYLKDGNKGIRIEDVVKNSPAATIGLKKGDIIIAINRERVKNIIQLHKIIKNNSGFIALNIVRGENNIFILLR